MNSKDKSKWIYHLKKLFKIRNQNKIRELKTIKNELIKRISLIFENDLQHHIPLYIENAIV